MCVSLSPPEDYTGGELEFDFSTPDKKNIQLCPSMRSQGSVVVFPSFMQHRIKPVTRGTRYSLVAWFCGNLFV
jgi:PKHD-type hydroxylase